MAAEGTLDILGEIQALVSDKLQVVSYKWLSRNFSVSSNDAKRLLQEFVSKHANELEVIYTLSGWLKKNPEIYNVKLVPGRKLTGAKGEFRENCSVQVYSVQTCIPKDPAVLWSAEFVQAEELFDQPSMVDNCLRDNRFCGVSNSFVKRVVNGKSMAMDPSKTKIGSGIAVPSKTNGLSPSFPTLQQGQIHQPNLTSGVQSPNVNRNSAEDNVNPKVHAEPSKSHVDKERASAPLPNKKKVANEKSLQGGNGGALANLWGRASAKSKPQNPTVDAAHDIARASAITSDTQICAQEALDSISSDDDDQHISHKESSGGIGRKRRVVLEFSDDEDEENIVSLASPDPPKSQSILGSRKNAELEKKLSFDGQMGDQAGVKHERTVSNSISSKGDSERSGKSEISGNAMPNKAKELGLEKHSESNKRDQATNSVSTSPKRKKVLKTRIDERGREVTEVVWEGDAADGSKVNTSATDNSSANRPPPTDKAAPSANHMPSNPVGKTGGTKTTKMGKDTKQANILSFFKKT